MKKQPEYINNLIYQSKIFKKLLSNYMKNGKLYASYNIILNSFKKIKMQSKKNPIMLLYKLIYLKKLPIDLISVKKSGRVYKLPKVAKFDRQLKTVLKLLSKVTYINKKTSSFEVLTKEIIEGFHIKKKTLVQKQLDTKAQIAIDNQPFLHFRWSAKRRKNKR